MLWRCNLIAKMKKITLISIITTVILLFVEIPILTSDNQHINKNEYQYSDTITYMFAGDIMGHMPQIKAAYVLQGDSFNFRPSYQYIKPYIKQADLAIGNLEVPLAGKPYSGYPNFSSPEALVEGPLYAGFDIMLMANNHAADKGKMGIEKTIDILSKKSKYTGAFLNQAQRDSVYPLIINVKGLKTAILNCTYDTNNNPVPQPLIVNLIDTAQIRKDVQTAKQRGAKFIIITIHWGTEYKTSSNKEQEMLASFFAKIEIDLVIGSHPHVVENFDYAYKPDSTKVPVYYSLGNMISNQTKRNTNGGILAKISIDAKSHKIIQCEYIPFYVHKGTMNGLYQYYLIPTKEYLQKPERFKIGHKADSLLRIFHHDTNLRLSNIN